MGLIFGYHRHAKRVAIKLKWLVGELKLLSAAAAVFQLQRITRLLCLPPGFAQPGSDILVDLDDNVQLISIRKCHGVKDALINETAQMKDVLFNRSWQGVAGFCDFRLNDTPYPLVVLERCI